ncbi:MAG: ABC transporter ATP-binding protein/permease [Treponema sp.]|nr:ABC transporter ATP-binding protein/permease [Treponema sp.]
MSKPSQQRMGIKQNIAYILRAVGIIRKVYPWYLTLSNTLSVLRALEPLTALYFSARIIDELSGGRDLARIALYAGTAVGLAFVLRGLVTFIAFKRDYLYGSEFPWLMERHFINEHFARMDYEYVEDRRVNELLEKIHGFSTSNGAGLLKLVWTVPELTERFVGTAAAAALLAGMFRFSTGTGGAFIDSPWAVAPLLLSLFIPVITRTAFTGPIVRAETDLTESNTHTNTVMSYYRTYIESGNAGKDIRVFAQQHYVLSLMFRPRTWYWNYSRVKSLTSGLSAAANAFVGGLAYLLIGLRALAGIYSIGEVTQYVGAVTAFAGSLTGLISVAAEIRENNVFLSMLYEFLDLPSLKYQGTLTTEKRQDNDYALEFHNVSFKYPGSEQYALKNLSLKLNTGERLAVVGMNGSGKTTMIKLLTRLYDPAEGYISLNGIDIKKYDYDEYIRIFSVVFQDFNLPAFPLGQNVAAGLDYDPGRVRQALEDTGFGARLDELPRGLDTPLYKDYDEDGLAISGGEAQKIALARVIYRDAPFVILDEPTAALDPLAEFEIYSHFDSIIGGKTAVYISHRLSSCRFCHNIAVFHDGRIVQQGSHETLLADTGGKYAELWNAQAQHYV